MALPIFADRVREITSTVGSGPILCGGAVPGFRSFAAAFAAGVTVAVTVESGDGSSWEIALATVAINAGVATLTLATILASSANGAALNLTGQSVVYNSLPAELLSPGGAPASVTAAGTGQSTATLITTPRTIITSGAGGGVQVPVVPLQPFRIRNATTGVIMAYPLNGSGAQLEQLGVGYGAPIQSNQTVQVDWVSSTQGYIG